MNLNLESNGTYKDSTMAPQTNLLNHVRLNHVEAQVSDRLKAATNAAICVESVKLKLTE